MGGLRACVRSWTHAHVFQSRWSGIVRQLRYSSRSASFSCGLIGMGGKVAMTASDTAGGTPSSPNLWDIEPCGPPIWFGFFSHSLSGDLRMFLVIVKCFVWPPCNKMKPRMAPACSSPFTEPCPGKDQWRMKHHFGNRLPTWATARASATTA